jgi:hypothetical protein
VQCSVVQWSEVQCLCLSDHEDMSSCAVLCSAVQCSAVQCREIMSLSVDQSKSAVQCSVVQCSAGKCSVVKCSTVLTLEVLDVAVVILVGEAVHAVVGQVPQGIARVTGAGWATPVPTLTLTPRPPIGN